METPFVYGKLVSGHDFTNRTEELKRLSQNFLSGINTILISPRRWGKSSLVTKAASEVGKQEKNVRFVFLDMFNIRNEGEFYREYSEQTLKATSTKYQDIINYTKKFFRQWIPRISFSPDHFQEFSLGLDWQEVKKQPDEILELPQRIAEMKGWKINICIDEFQNISFFDDSLAFQKRLRSHWQQHKNVAYCLYGSKRHMMIDVFSKQSMPFYLFGDLVLIEKILPEHWVQFIVERFTSTGKSINEAQAGRIAFLAENHPFYVQQLAQSCWLRCDKILTDDLIDIAMETLILQLSLLFQQQIESLSSTQINYLGAVLNGETRLNSKEIIQKYQLGTSANIARIQQALINKEIIDLISGKPEIQDPLFKAWMKKHYFKAHY
ncbi:MAG: ATPase [Bacteroidetes bacterium]|nr:ATPase [Bacteroidota bacterium]